MAYCIVAYKNEHPSLLVVSSSYSNAKDTMRKIACENEMIAKYQYDSVYYEDKFGIRYRVTSIECYNRMVR